MLITRLYNNKMLKTQIANSKKIIKYYFNRAMK